MDLLTVVEHEIGHVLGFHHDDPIAPMADVLAPGRRILLPAGSIPDGSTELAAAAVDDADSAPPVLDLSDETGNLTITLAPEGDVIVSGAVVDSDHNSTFGGVDGIASGSGDDTLVGPGLTNLWAITGSNAGTLAAGSLTPLTFTGVENLRGGDGSDTFAMTADGRLSGVVDGGRGNDTLVGADTPNTWVIDGTDAGRLNGQSFARVENLTGGAAADTFIWAAGGSLSGVVSGGLGDDTLVGADTPNTWTLTGVGAGTLNGQSFTGSENLVGGEASDRSVFAGGSVTGRIDGRGGVNTLDYSAATLAVTVDLTTGSAAGAGSVTGVGAVVGGSGTDTLVGPASSNTWTISDTDTGTVNLVTFRSIENLVGGSESDTFVLGPSGKVTGHISGGDGDDVLVAADTPNTWTISGPDAGTLNGVAFSSVETAQGGASEDVFVVTVAGLLAGALLGGPGVDRLRGADQRNVWRVTSRNSGKLNQQGFGGVESLEGGSGDDEFVLADGASVDGVIEGGAGNDTLTVDFTDAPMPRAITFDGGSGGFDSLSLLAGHFRSVTYAAEGPDTGTIRLDSVLIAYAGLEPITDTSRVDDRVFNVLPSGIDHTIRIRDDGDPDNGLMTIDSGGTGGFESITFVNPANSLTVNAGDGNDSIILDALDHGFHGSIVVNGGAGSDGLTAPNTPNVWSINGAGAGSVDFVTFGSIEHLLGGTQPDDFVFADGVAFAGTIDGGGGVNMLDYSAFSTRVVVDL